MNLYRQINKWLIDKYKPLNDWIYFNATPVTQGTVALNSVTGERVVSKDILGRKHKEITFGIDMISMYDNTGTSNTNLDAMDEVLNFSDWLDNITADNYPDFGKTNTIEKIEVLNNVPDIFINETNSLAKYEFQARIKYVEERKENNNAKT